MHPCGKSVIVPALLLGVALVLMAPAAASAQVLYGSVVGTTPLLGFSRV